LAAAESLAVSEAPEVKGVSGGDEKRPDEAEGRAFLPSLPQVREFPLPLPDPTVPEMGRGQGAEEAKGRVEPLGSGWVP
jgi:hypothetical protein